MKKIVIPPQQLGNKNSCLRFLLVLVIFLSLSGQVFSQKLAQGSVVDDSGVPLPGVSVFIDGTTVGTVSDIDGKFMIQASVGDVIHFSFIGFKDQKVEYTDQVLSIVMSPDVFGLDEVVAIGYGSVKKGDVTSAIASVKSDDFIKGAVKDAAQLIQGKVAGLTIATPSGDPTEGAVIMLRGNSSLLGSSAPLVLVDGVPGSLESVAPEDIESIDVLKDGSASAIYGTRGTNGVIIITTKRSTKGMEPTISYDGYVSIASISRKLDFMNAEDLRAKWNEGYSFTGANLKDYGANTDWLDEITRKAVSHVHNVVFRGGTKNTSLTASLNYKNNQGVFIKTDNEKYTGRIDVSHSMFDGKLTADIGTIISEQNYWTGGDGYSFNKYVYRQALIRNPTEPIKNEDGRWYERDVYFYDNPVAYLKESDGENKYRNVRFKASLTYKLFEGLNVKGMYTRKSNSNIRGYYETKNHVSTTKYGSEGYASRGTENYLGNYTEFTVNYKKVIAGDHNLSVLAGYNYEDNMTEGFWANNKYFPTDGYTYNNLEIGSGLTKGEAGMDSYKYSDKLIAFFSRVSYSFANKYLFMASLRREGSSRFGKDHKWGNFPGVSLGWRMSEEDFVKEINWIDNLKLRAGFGVTGTNVADSYNSLSSLNYSDYFYSNKEWVRKLVPARNDNPDLRWEKKEEINIGLDFGLLNGRVSGAFDFYNRKTKDALWNYDVPTPPYLYGSIMTNVGEIKNQGFEALINVTPIKTPSFEWKANMTFSTNKNELVSLSNDKFKTTNDFFYPEDGYTGEPIQTTTHIVKIGGEIGNFYGLKSVDISDDGIWIIEKPNGERISATESSTDDRQVLGNGIPKYYASWNNSFRYKNFDLNINMRGAFSYQILNFSRMFYENPKIAYNTLNSAYDKVYGKAVLNDDQRYVSYYVEDGDYWKIDNITLGYTVNLKNKDVFKNLRVYVSGLNLHTFTGYKGIDPEVKQTGLAPGNDERDKYPTTRTFTFGVNVTF
ncbi:SusC/RagA family TonB-linked outer membrane protein [Labilibaculum sp. A4]|uniref:SusC/RagA family TonB-linked outer membrane protein n=1 Tax=Labilibaculum euxinus TaxID=2686357 RepID=UPI000F619A25|nr:TonB-dependent receptor [Labilibaculum euxinus]MDQ1770662.1 TonB-dependent receptor [Labilibaculum euxinus]MWN75833.1 SusC/RagA family TonB-linked outer membrane protein [Labilibaculum euxinus]